MPKALLFLRESQFHFPPFAHWLPADWAARGSPISAGEQTPTESNSYQNGAYRDTPTVWLAAILKGSHPELARQIFEDMITHLRGENFRQGEAFNAPWECIGHVPEASNYPTFLASVTLPCGIIKDL